MSARLTKAREIAEMVYADCATDALKLDSTPFTPRGIGEVLGATLAMIAAVAKVCEHLADEIESLQRTLDARTEDAA